MTKRNEVEQKTDFVTRYSRSLLISIMVNCFCLATVLLVKLMSKSDED